jgi:hypothetical protein
LQRPMAVQTQHQDQKGLRRRLLWQARRRLRPHYNWNRKPVATMGTKGSSNAAPDLTAQTVTGRWRQPTAPCGSATRRSGRRRSAQRIWGIVISFTDRLVQPLMIRAPRTQRGGTGMTCVWRNRVALIAIAAVILGGAATVSYALAPQPGVTMLGPGWQCHRVPGIYTTCSRAEP